MRTQEKIRVVARFANWFEEKFPWISWSLRAAFSLSWFSFRLAEFTSVAILVVLAGRGIEISYQWVNEVVIDSRYKLANYLSPQVVKPFMTEAEIIALVSDFANQKGINPIVGLATVSTESNNNPYRWRYEETWKKQYSNKVPCQGKNEEECKLIYSSIGLMQVSYVIWKDFCELKSPIDLFDPKTNIDCGFKIMMNCLYNNMDEVQDNTKLLRLCFRKYNGSGEMAERYADKMMASLSRFTIPDRKLFSDRAVEVLQIPRKEEPAAIEEEPRVIRASLKPSKKRQPIVTSSKSKTANNNKDELDGEIKLARR